MTKIIHLVCHLTPMRSLLPLLLFAFFVPTMLPAQDPCHDTPLDITTPYTVTFEEPIPCWMPLDMDGDGSNWQLYSLSADNNAHPHNVHNGDKSYISYSYDYTNSQNISANNHLISQAILIPCRISAASLHLWVASEDPFNYSEKFSIYLTDEGGTRIATLANNEIQPYYDWRALNYDLTPYAGRVIHVVIRHHGDGQSAFLIDDITIQATLTPGDTPSTVIDTTVCGSFTWNHLSYSNSTIINDTTGMPGCDTITTVNLTVNQEYNVFDTTYLQGVNSVPWHGAERDISSPTYDLPFSTTAGCDSNFHLYIYQLDASPIDTFACDRLTLHGTTYTSDTTVNYRSAHLSGEEMIVDSIIAYNVTIGHSEIHDTYLDNRAFEYGGNTYILHRDTLVPHPTLSGGTCPTLLHAIPGAVPAVVLVTDTTGCVSVNVGGFDYTDNTTIYDTSFYATVDTVRQLNINIATTYEINNHINLYREPTNRYFWAGHWLDIDESVFVAGTFRDTLTTVNGCDSIVFVEFMPQAIITPVGTCDTMPWTVTGGLIITTDTILYNTTSSVTVNHVTTENIDIYDFTPRPIRHTTDSNTTEAITWGGRLIDIPGTYYDTLTSHLGCDSVERLNLHIAYDTATSVRDLEVCDSAFLGSVVYTTSSIVVDTTHRPGHDTIYTVNLTVHTSQMVYDTADAEYLYRYHDSVWRYSGDYIIRPSVPTCDYTYHLHLSIQHEPCDTTYGPTQSSEGCGSTIWEGTEYRTSTRLYDTLVNATGCDSLRQVRITVWPTYRDSVMVRPAADDESYSWTQTGRTYIRNGVYRDTMHSVNGCDSIAILRLLWINPLCVTDTTNIDTSACDGLTWKGIFYNTETVLDTLYLTEQGCDSVVKAHLHITRDNATYTDTTVCDFLWWKGNTYRKNTDTVFFYGTNMASYCDSSERLRVRVHHSSNIYDTLRGCDSYRWGTTVFYHSQDHVANPGRNIEGCDSVIHLHVIINTITYTDSTAYTCDSLRYRDSLITASGTYSFYGMHTSQGCDSVMRLNITVNASQHDSATLQDCDFVLYYDSIYTSSGRFVQVMGTTADGCLHTATLAVNILRSSHKYIDTTYCDEMAWHAHTFTSDTTATWVTSNHLGCDSIEHLTLDIRYSTSSLREVTACDQYIWHDSTHYQSTFVQHHGINHEGCDSVMTLHLNIIHSDTTDTAITACNYLTWHDSTYRTSTIDTFFINNENCLAAEVLHLTMGYSTSASDTRNVCDSFAWADTVFRHSTNTVRRLRSMQGCDSTVSLSLTVRRSSYSDVYESECNNYRWHGTNYTQSTDSVRFVRTNRAGCDSIVTLHITIYHDTVVHDTTWACETYQYNNRTYSQSTTLGSNIGLTRRGCDSTTVLHLEIGHAGQTIIDTATVCNSFRWIDGIAYFADTVVNKTMPDRYGCNNNHFLLLTVNYDSIIYDTARACNSYGWHNTTYNRSGDHLYTRPTIERCTLFHMLHLTVNYDREHYIDTTVCRELQLSDGTRLTNNFRNLHHVIGNTVGGCDSTLVITLQVNGRYAETAMQGCQWVAWRDSNYIETVTLYDTTPLGNGCDSIYARHINVIPIVHTYDTIYGCGMYRFNDDTTYYVSTNFADTIIGRERCDTVRHYNLTVDSAIVTEFNATSNKMYEWNGTYYNATGNYVQHFESTTACDSIVVLHLTYTDIEDPIIVNHDNRLLMVDHYPHGQNNPYVQYYAYRWYRGGVINDNIVADAYSNPDRSELNGCFFVECAIDDTYEHWLRSNLICIGNVGVDSLSMQSPHLSIMPNPVRCGSIVTVSTTLNANLLQGVTLTLYDIYGRAVQQQEGLAPMTIKQPQGIYVMELTTTQGIKHTKRLIVR